MTAKEMFEELGFFPFETKYYYENGITEDILIYDNCGNIVEFNLSKNNYIVFDSIVLSYPENSNYKMKAIGIYKKLHKAITQQMKELGWLND